jgi:hypothetical protein
MNAVWIPLGLAALDWLALRFGWKWLEPVTKPAVTAGILVWMLLEGPVFTTPAVWFFAGITLCLAGELLLIPSVDRFKPASGATLLAVLACSAGLNTTPFPFNASTALFAAVVLLLALRVHARIAAGLAAAGRSDLRLPVLVFTAAVSLLVLSGLATLAKEAWPPIPALLAASGVVLLAIAAIVQGWDRFVRPLPGSALGFRIAYHLGRIALIGGASMMFS